MGIKVVIIGGDGSCSPELINGFNGTEAKRAMDELLVAHEIHLPQFTDIISKCKEQGIFCYDKVVRKITASGH